MPGRKSHRLDYSKARVCCVRTRQGTINFFLLKSDRRTTIEISVNEDEQVRVVAPVYASYTLVEQFINERAGWILKRIQEVGQANQFVRSRDYNTGNEFLFLGKNYPLYVEEGRARSAVSFDENGWIITVPAGISKEEQSVKVKEQLVRWYRRQAEEVMASRVFHYVRMMGLEPMTIAVRTQKSIWGCCSYHDKKISFNWLLALAPLHVIDYVIVHELAHLSHPNHSKKFWQKVEIYLPDYKERQEWLNTHRLEMKLP
ncbi:MAG: SprT family zinc-dependent metalloprotease [Candidatus Omnitrophota bacterium]